MLYWLFTKTPLLFLTQSFWRDEAFSFILAKRNILDIIFLTAKDFNPPFFYFILHYWIKIFGGSEISLRSVSLIFYWATLYVAFMFLNDIFKIKLKRSLIWLIFFIINPMLLYYAFEARMYTMLAFFASLSFYAFMKKDRNIYLLSAILGLFTHYFMVLVVVSQIFLLIIDRSKKYGLKLIYPVLSLIVFSPWLAFVAMKKNFISTSFWIGSPQIKYALDVLGILYTGNETSYYNTVQTFNHVLSDLFLATLLLAIPLIFGVFIYFKKGSVKIRPTLGLLFVWAFGIPLLIALVSFYKPVYLARYLIFSVVGLVLFIIYVFEKMNVYLKLILSVLLLLVTINYFQIQFPYLKKVDSRTTLNEIKALANKNDLVYVTSELDYFTAAYYVGEDRVYIYGKSYEEIPDFVGKVLIPKNKIATSLPVYPKKAFVLTPDNQYTVQAIY